MLMHFPVYISMNKFCRLILTFAIGRTMVLKAARYSASPIGGERPPDHARFTVKPTPSPTPHCNNRKTESISTNTVQHYRSNISAEPSLHETVKFLIRKIQIIYLMRGRHRKSDR
jgi:hypothetical protein